MGVFMCDVDVRCICGALLQVVGHLGCELASVCMNHVRSTYIYMRMYVCIYT